MRGKKGEGGRMKREVLQVEQVLQVNLRRGRGKGAMRGKKGKGERGRGRMKREVLQVLQVE
jgi:hypothetical protein